MIAALGVWASRTLKQRSLTHLARTAADCHSEVAVTGDCLPTGTSHYFVCYTGCDIGGYGPKVRDIGATASKSACIRSVSDMGNSANVNPPAKCSRADRTPIRSSERSPTGGGIPPGSSATHSEAMCDVDEMSLAASEGDWHPTLMNPSSTPSGRVQEGQGKRGHETTIVPDGNLHRRQGKRGHETTILPDGNLHRQQGKRGHETPILPDGNLNRRQGKRGHETTILPDGNFQRRSGDDKESMPMKPLLCPMLIYIEEKESVAMKPLLCPMAIYTDDKESVAMKPLLCPMAIYTDDKESVAMKPLLCRMAIYTDGNHVTMKPLLCPLAIYTDALQMTRTDCP
ncbi:hypothetical protein E1301_Tti019672 [Triplophysa tibetana]|uniref:Uncharacterized protein n=1 Tax=Triplophysa tibetana TaxID=1572043 RepID=A0A5A9PHH6_9TELE|nr:hypothetical protein E1301_Tti019672 [Triplophysa tibetana]